MLGQQIRGPLSGRSAGLIERFRLSSVAIPDDVNSMRGTLSQWGQTPISNRGAAIPPARPRLLAVAIATLLIAIKGCSGGGDATTHDDTSSTASTSAPAEPKAPFTWPEDPSHPVLEIEVESDVASGTILIELMPELAPATVVNVVELAEQGFYDGTTFHRVIPDFMIQGGDPRSRDRDPTNDGTGGADIKIQDEFSDAPFMRGVVGMGNRGRPNSTSTQFFIMQADNLSLKGRYNAIGRVLKGLDIVDQVTTVEIDRTGRWGPKDRPVTNVVMTRIRPIGHVAKVQEALDRENSVSQIAFSETGSGDSNAGNQGPPGSSAPAAPNLGEDWELLEAAGR